MSAVAIDFSELQAAVRDLWANGGAALAEVTPVIAEDLVARVHEEFATEGHGLWEDLAESTKAKRARRQSSGVFTILQDTGLLAGSITPHWETTVAEAFTNVPYAGYHTSKRRRRVIPLRDFTDIDLDAAQAEAAEIILAQVLRG